MAQSSKHGAIPFHPSARSVPPTSVLPMPPGSAANHTSVETPPGLDLSGKRKAWFLIGRGRIGKTTFARWLAETMDQRGGAAIIAAADPVNRSLRQFLDNVTEPPSSDPEDVKTWLRDLLQYQMEEQLDSIIDLGGGNTSLSALLADMPDLADVLSQSGVEAVACHVIGADPHDCVPLAVTEAEGFQPKATVIVLNEAHGRRHRFDAVLAQAEVRAALDRGAMQLWMPLLNAEAARQCDRHGWRYYQVRSTAGPFTASAVQTWLRRMAAEFEPIKTWLPE